MDRLLRLGGGMPGLNQGPPPSDAPVVDTAEQVRIVTVYNRARVIPSDIFISSDFRLTALYYILYIEE